MAINSAMYNGVSGLNSFSTGLEVTSDNVANIGTTGYKANSIRFGDMVSSYFSTQSKDTDRRGAGSVILGIATDYSQGPTISTTNWADMAINGDGFFAVSLLDNQGNLVNPNEVYYTRDGSFNVNKDGYLVNYQGYGVLNSNGDPIYVGDPTDPVYGNFYVDETGQIYGSPVGVGTTITDGDLVAQGGEVPVGEEAEFTADADDTVTITVRDQTTGRVVGTGTIEVEADVAETLDYAALQAAGIDLANGDYSIEVEAQGSATTIDVATSTFSVTGCTLTDAGTFQLFNPASVTVVIRNADGEVVENISIPADTITASPQEITVDDAFLDANGISLPDGNYTFDVQVGSDPVALQDSQLRVSLFPNQQGLIRKGGNLYSVGPESKDPIHGTANDSMRGSIAGYTIEGSNVDLAKEMVNMIIYQSNYNANTKSITTGRDMLDTTINLVR